MGTTDKAMNAVDEVSGKVKEAVGKLVGNEDLEAEGQIDQVKSELKQAGEKVKDAFKG